MDSRQKEDILFQVISNANANIVQLQHQIIRIDEAVARISQRVNEIFNLVGEEEDDSYEPGSQEEESDSDEVARITKKSKKDYDA